VRVEAAKAKRPTPEARAEEAKIREALEREYRETGTIEAAGDAVETEDMIAFSRFMFSLRGERERLGLYLVEQYRQAKITHSQLEMRSA
jgi:hypothetical protein